MDSFVGMVSAAGERVTSNLKATLANMSPEKFIRLVIIVGAYMLLRPFIIKLGEKSQMKSHEKAEEQPLGEISPNQLRGQVNVPEDSEDEEEGDVAGASTAADWGKKARRRQRDVIKKMLDAEEKRLSEQQADEEDKDIEEFLVKE